MPFEPGIVRQMTSPGNSRPTHAHLHVHLPCTHVLSDFCNLSIYSSLKIVQCLRTRRSAIVLEANDPTSSHKFRERKALITAFYGLEALRQSIIACFACSSTTAAATRPGISATITVRTSYSEQSRSLRPPGLGGKSDQQDHLPLTWN